MLHDVKSKFASLNAPFAGGKEGAFGTLGDARYLLRSLRDGVLRFPKVVEESQASFFVPVYPRYLACPVSLCD